MTKEIIENDPYKLAGVDIDAGNNLIDKIKKITEYLIFNNSQDLHIQTQPNNLICYFYLGRKSFLLYT